MRIVNGLIIVLSLASCAATAQEFYFRVGAGYAFPQAGQTFDGTGQAYNGTQNNSTYLQTYNVKAASFSSGVQGVFGLGYLFNDHIGLQLDAGIGLSNTMYSYTAQNVQVGGVLSNITTQQQANVPVFLMPSLVVQTGGNPWNIYARMGLALPISSQLTEDEIITNAPGTGATVVDDITFHIKNSFSLGFTAAVGMKYRISDNMSVWGEASLLSSSLYVKEATLVNFAENGQNIPLSYIGGPQTVKYSRNVSIDTNYTSQPTYSQPFSNIAVNIGVSFSIGGHSRSAADSDKDIDRPRGGRFH